MISQKNILLVHLYSNGDCLYATAIARQIKTDFPGCKLTWAIAGFCKSIINNNPYVDEVIEVNEVKKNDVPAFRKYKKRILQEKAAGEWDEVFVTHNMDSNIQYYDGTIRGMILRAYPHTITNVRPELVLSDEEKNNVKRFAEKYALDKFKNVILWEYAPQSGQSNLNFDFVMHLSKKITQLPETCIILTSANKFNSTSSIIDASELSIRENAALTHYCHLLIGCSSGITWLSISNAAKQLPMIQLLNPDAPFRNIPSEDFKRFDLNTDGLIELFNFNEQNIFDCIKSFLSEGINIAQQKFNQALPQNFGTTRKITYNLLCYSNFKGISNHVRIMKSVYQNHFAIDKQVLLGIIDFPYKLIRNIFRKKIAPLFFRLKN